MNVDSVIAPILQQWGAPGAIIALLVGLIGFQFKLFIGERKDMRESHATERAEMRKVAGDRQDQLVTLAEASTAQNRATEQVLRELTGVLGEIKAQTRGDHAR